MKRLIALAVIAIGLASCKDFEAQEKQQAQQRTLDSMKLEMERQKLQADRQRTIDSMKAVADAQRASQRPVIVNNPTPAQQAEARRKGLSSPVTGALIGAGVGAASGALIDKDKAGRGAVIGGVSGAALGAGTGAIIDAEKKKKQQKK